jgi:mannitol/fructose-specific phosphotransferase system IIA component (Ntr-type)
VLSPPDAGNDHLQTLAGIATLLRSGPLRETLLRASEPAAVMQALGRHSRSAP